MNEFGGPNAHYTHNRMCPFRVANELWSWQVKKFRPIVLTQFIKSLSRFSISVRLRLWGCLFKFYWGTITGNLKNYAVSGVDQFRKKYVKLEFCYLFINILYIFFFEFWKIFCLIYVLNYHILIIIYLQSNNLLTSK